MEVSPLVRPNNRDPSSTGCSAQDVVAIDISRLLKRLHHPAPRGIDRVELEYVIRLRTCEHLRCHLLICFDGRWRELTKFGADILVGELARRWLGLGRAGPRTRMVSKWLLSSKRARFLLQRWLSKRPPIFDDSTIYLNVGHTSWLALSTLPKQLRGNIVVMVHDLQPINQASYFAEHFSAQFKLGLAEVVRRASTIIVNSSCTGREVHEWATRTGMTLPPVLVAPLGIRDVPLDVARVPRHEEPFFVTLGISDPRKNFSLLRTVWSDFRVPPVLYCLGEPGDAPRPEGIRCLPAMDDVALTALMRRARALLMPSIEEGYGLPVAEALSSGVPVLCSDIPALREIGQGVPEYLGRDPREWTSAVLDYTEEGSKRRQAQLERMNAYCPPRWDQHIWSVLRHLGLKASQTPGSQLS